MRDEEFEGLLRSAVRALKEVGEYNQETVRNAARKVGAMNLPWEGVWPSERNPQVAARIEVAGDQIAARAIAESGKGKSEEKDRACCCC